MKHSKLYQAACMALTVAFVAEQSAAFSQAPMAGQPKAGGSSPASSDVRFQQLWDTMKESVPLVDNLLLNGRAGEGADGYLAAPPGVNLSSDENSLIHSENDLRRQVYEQMAALTGGKAPEMGQQRAQRYSSRLKKGIYRQQASAAGAGEWTDGYSDEERVKTYVLEFAEPPPQRVEATKPFVVKLQVKDKLGRPARHPFLTGASFTASALLPSDHLGGTLTAPLVEGVAEFGNLSFPTMQKSTLLSFQGQGKLQHLKIETPPFSVLEKTISSDDIGMSLPAWERRAERLLNLPPSPSRDRELTEFRRLLESSSISLATYPNALKTTVDRLAEIQAKVAGASVIPPAGQPPTGTPPSPPPFPR